MDPLIKEAGFEDVTVEVVRQPLGTWPADKKQKEIGAFGLLASETAFEAIGLVLLTNELGMSGEEVKELAAACHKELGSRKIHCYYRQ